LLISPAINDQDAGEVALSLLAAADQAYADFLPGAIPVVADDRTATALQNSGARFVRKYCQSIWMRPGFLAWYRHVEKFYERITRANKRHGLGAKHIQLSDSAKTS
jgi:hypothetical protein